MDNVNIVDKFASILSSDVLSAYSDLQAVLSERNIVPGSFRHSQSPCVDMELSQLDSSAGNLYTRLRLGPVVNCTHPSTNQIRWSFDIPRNTIGIQLSKSTTAAFAPVRLDNSGVDRTTKEPLRIWLGYCNAAQIASEIAITYQGAVSGWSSGAFNEQHTMLAQHSLSNAIHENSVTLTSIDALFAKSSAGCGTIIEIPIDKLHADDEVYHYAIPHDITITGIIDLNQLNPIFNHFPIMTPSFSNIWIRLNMPHFMRSLQKVVLNKFNPATGEYLPVQYTPPEKPDVCILPNHVTNGVGTGNNTVITAMTAGDDTEATTADISTAVNALRAKIITANSITLTAATITPSYSNYYIRVVNVAGGFNDANHPNNPITVLPGVKFNTMETRQFTYQLEDQAQVDNMFRSKGFFLQPTKYFRSTKFSTRNSSNQLQTTTGISNIGKFYITFDYRAEYPLYLPNPLIHDVNPLWKNSSILSSVDSKIDKNVAYRIFNCFVDVDLVSPPTSLFDSIMVFNDTKDKNKYASKNILTDNNGMMRRGTSTPKYLPNQFVYAFDASGGCFLRGYNVVGKDYDGTAQFDLQFKDTQSQDNDSPTTTATDGIDTQDTWLKFINTPLAGRFSTSPGTSALHCLCDGVIRFTFGADGNVSEIRVDGSV